MVLALILYMVTMIQDAIASGRSLQMLFGQMLELVWLVVIVGVSVLALWEVIDITDRRIAWFMLGALGLALAWFLYKEIRDAIAGGRLMQTLLGWALVLVVGIVVFVVISTGCELVRLGIEKLRLQIRKWRFRLLTGVTMETALRESPYELLRGGWGEADYLVDKRTGEFVEWEDPDGAEAWILRQYLKQRRNERRNRT